MKGRSPRSVYSMAGTDRKPPGSFMKNSTLSLKNFSSQKKPLTTNKLLQLSKKLSVERSEPRNFLDYDRKRKGSPNIDKNMFKKISPIKYKSGRTVMNNLHDILPH